MRDVAATSAVKVFGIGLNKTGTTTLGRMGATLGLRCTSFSLELLEDVVRRRDFARVRETVARFDLFEDWPWPLIYRELDAMYPGSKFVLTVRRSEQAWLASLETHALKIHPWRHGRKLAYGYRYPQRHARAHIDFYRRHNDAVRAYFKDRPDDFVELCWERGDGYRELCALLGRPAPDAPTPRANSAAAMPTRRTYYLANRFLSLFG